MAQSFDFWSPGVEESNKITITLSSNLFKETMGGFIEDYEKFRQTDSAAIIYLDTTRFVKNDNVFE